MEAHTNFVLQSECFSDRATNHRSLYKKIICTNYQPKSLFVIDTKITWSKTCVSLLI